MSNPIQNAFRNLVATQRDRYLRSRGVHQDFRCQRMTARDSGPDSNESGNRHREPNYTTAVAEPKSENCNPCPDLKRELDSAQTVDGDLNPSVRPVTHSDKDVTRLLPSEVLPTRRVERIKDDAESEASRATS